MTYLFHQSSQVFAIEDSHLQVKLDPNKSTMESLGQDYQAALSEAKRIHKVPVDNVHQIGLESSPHYEIRGTNGPIGGIDIPKEHELHRLPEGFEVEYGENWNECGVCGVKGDAPCPNAEPCPGFPKVVATIF